jgi:hypothetical protein
MTKRAPDGDANLTGIWNGLYTYPDGRSIAFVATLIEAHGLLTGTTHEPGASAGTAGVTLFAGLIGSRDDRAISFTKTYDDPDSFHRSPVVYEGTLNGDATEIEGRWTIVKVWSGKFLMIRSGERAVAAARKEFERA